MSTNLTNVLQEVLQNTTNPTVLKQLMTPDATYVEIVELPNHPFFLGCQFHPEFKSKPLEPHPLFSTFIAAAYEHGSKRRAHKETAAVEMFHRPGKVARR